MPNIWWAYMEDTHIYADMKSLASTMWGELYTYLIYQETNMAARLHIQLTQSLLLYGHTDLIHFHVYAKYKLQHQHITNYVPYISTKLEIYVIYAYYLIGIYGVYMSINIPHFMSLPSTMWSEALYTDNANPDASNDKDTNRDANCWLHMMSLHGGQITQNV